MKSSATAVNANMRTTDPAALAGHDGVLGALPRTPDARVPFSPRPSTGANAAWIGRLAMRSLYRELALHPKPGLVSLQSNGAHRDMDASTFMRSLFALRSYFRDVAAAGARDASFDELRALGVRAEETMLAATGGINTHRGAIFALGLLGACAASLRAAGAPLDDSRLRGAIVTRFSEALSRVRVAGTTHGEQVFCALGVDGARGEARRGFPHVFELALPTLRVASARGADPRTARTAALFALLEHVPDTNVLYRGGVGALRFMQRSARAFNAAGGVFARDAGARAVALDRALTARNVSPGGCADLLATTLFVHALQTEPA